MKLTAFPKCYMDELCVTRTMTVFDWIEMARQLDVDGLELYDGFLASTEPDYLERVRRSIEDAGMTMPMLCYSPDFTIPDADARRAEVEKQRAAIDLSASLGGRFCRTLSGQRRPEV